MKLKNFFNSQRKNAIVQELKNDFKPILEKVTLPVTTYAENNPRKTFFLMILIASINMIILLFFTDAFKTEREIDITDLKLQHLKHHVNSGGVPDIAVSFESIRKVRVIKDSLAWLMSLKHMTFQDTLTFVRIMDEFQDISSGTSGIPPLKLEDLRKAKQFDKSTIDTTIK